MHPAARDPRTIAAAEPARGRASGMNEPCFICQRDPAERPIRRYRISVCGVCWDRNWDGWPKQSEPRILEHLETHGLPVPVRNVFGRLPRD